MLRILERVTGAHAGTGGRGVAPSMAEYWLKATERIMNNLDCTPELERGLLFLLLGSSRVVTVVGAIRARGGNGIGRGQRAPGRAVGQTEVRQPALVYTTQRREDRDAQDVITGVYPKCRTTRFGKSQKNVLSTPNGRVVDKGMTVCSTRSCGGSSMAMWVTRVIVSLRRIIAVGTPR
ncbi:Putative competence-damage inducible [Gossypium arboreum]|uniref:Putative competence-damage inducible n=1 Tax=Gossypium arboreum TaxID=29729 RepID=A0A0B0PUT8_GOSAR|nr:Putative competence-damage inducible [Gossypium arboreum]